ncbi:MAG: thiolase family protein [Gammaproteobacteria bacterium]|nr:thiolase family protein [Gammaproteobacteria bacterium]NNL99433.1 thiolase family protein [Gammaproteobacteria bacterium]
MTDIAIPYGAYWTTPFARWQGSLAGLHALRFAAHVGKDALAQRNIDPAAFDYGVLGTSVPQQGAFYGLPWVTGLLGAGHVAGPTIAQACATSARVVATAADEITAGRASCALLITADRVSNGPHIYYPDPGGIGGTGVTEDWVLANFNRDPLAGCDMTTTAENCAERWNVSTAEQHEVVLRRYEQYTEALAETDGRCFQDRYMIRPLAIPDGRFRKTVGELTGDEGIHPSTAEGLGRLKPVKDGGTVTFGSQTHPADGNAGMVVCAAERAAELATDTAISIRVHGIGQAREELAYMPAAPIKAARRALDAAGIAIGDITAVKSHNPFAVNDIIFARETAFDVSAMNNFGCSLIWGHPQGPTGMRALIELIEELAMRGGGWGLFQGCAAGDSAMAVVIKVG